MIATYHNHSSFSDGKATIPEMIDYAARAGIDELGISDHLCLHPSGDTPGWATHPERLEDYFQALRRAQQREGKPVVRVGVEVCWFPQQREVIERVVTALPLDYVIGSVHEVDGFGVDGSPHAWTKLTLDEREHVHRRYWELMKELAESRLFDIAAHLDLAKKFGHFPQRSLDDVLDPALDALAAAGTVVELNTAGWHKPCADGYPTLDILRRCRARGIRVTISADAHRPQDLLRDFDRAAARLKEAGYDEVARFRNREVWTEPIDNASRAL